MTVPDSIERPKLGDFADEQEIPPPESAVPLVMVVVPCAPDNGCGFGNIGLTRGMNLISSDALRSSCGAAESKRCWSTGRPFLAPARVPPHCSSIQFRTLRWLAWRLDMPFPGEGGGGECRVRQHLGSEKNTRVEACAVIPKKINDEVQS